MVKIIIILGVALILGGCEVMKSKAQIEQIKIKEQISTAKLNSKVCVDVAMQNPQVKQFTNELIYESDMSPNKYTLLTTKEKPSIEQIAVIKSVANILGKCREVMMTSLIETPFRAVQSKYNNSIDGIYIKLIKGEISIGEANQENTKNITQYNADWESTWDDVNDRLRTMHNAEVDGKRKAVAAYIKQQQAQQMINQQGMQKIINSFPSETRTNCTTYGNQTDCTSR